MLYLVYLIASIDSIEADSSDTLLSTSAQSLDAYESTSSQSTIDGITLSWNGGDPDGDNVIYYIYFGAGSPSTLIGTVENTCSYYYSGTLAAGTTYYWKVVAEDEYGAITEGPVWYFTVSDNNPEPTPTYETTDTVSTVDTANTVDTSTTSTSSTSDTAVTSDALAADASVTKLEIEAFNTAV